MKNLLTQIVRAILLIFIQVFILSQIEIGWGIHIMIYPIFILLLPFDFKPILVLLIAFVFGMIIDSLSNTGGLQTSSLLALALFRYPIFKYNSPRDGYDGIYSGTIYEMGGSWFLKTSVILLLIQHVWFFVLESFSSNDFLYTLQKIVLSLPISYLFCLLYQFIFVKRITNR